LLIGLSIGPPSSAGMDVLQRFAPLRHRNLLFSVKQAGVPLGGVIAGLLMPWASQALGIGVAVTIAAAIGALTLFAVQPLRARVDATRESTLRLHWRMFLSPTPCVGRSRCWWRCRPCGAWVSPAAAWAPAKALGSRFSSPTWWSNCTGR
jgi:hypothetical protein